VNDPWVKPTLVGERVTLRPVSGEDGDALWEMVNDPEGRDLTATTATISREQSDAWYASRGGATGRLDLAIVENVSGEVVGEAVLNEHDPATSSANFRIALRGPAYYGRGLGGEATRLVVAHGLGPVGLERITLTVLARNPRAVAAYQRSGFRETGRYTEDGEEWVEMEVTREPGR
jgi:RimJ/RimL family protein N-acetyltransferase